jgi:hypothetical protein
MPIHSFLTALGSGAGKLEEGLGRAKTEGGSERLIALNQPAFDALVKWAGRLVESNAADDVFPACEGAGIERKHPDRERIDPSRPIKS